MLTVNPMERFSMKDILNHAWFRIDTEFESRNLINEIEQL
jgi:serine/threonine protein kinase